MGRRCSWLQLEVGPGPQAAPACPRVHGAGPQAGSSGHTPRAPAPLFPASRAAEATGQGGGSLALCSRGLRAMFRLFAAPPFPQLEGEGLGLSRQQHQRPPRTAAGTSHWSEAKKSPPQPWPVQGGTPRSGKGKMAAGQEARQGRPSEGGPTCGHRAQPRGHRWVQTGEGKCREPPGAILPLAVPSLAGPD